MVDFNRIQKLNSLANDALVSDKPYVAYKLKLRVAEEALYSYEQTRDTAWVELARELFEEAKRIRSGAKKTAELRSDLEGEELAPNFLVNPKVSLKDIGGLKRSKRALRESLEWPLKYKELMREYGLQHVLKGCLLYGPPGCGKTLLVEGTAHDLKTNLLEAHPSEIMSKWFGNSEKLVKKLFVQAVEKQPSIVFIDEVDKILPKSTTSSVIPRIISVFLQEMDGADTHDGRQIVVVMASNEPWRIKPSILRPGRCDRIIYIPPPDREARKEIFRIHSQSRRLVHDINFDQLADLTAPIESWHYSGSDIAEICNTAKKAALRKAINGNDDPYIGMNHFSSGLKTVKPSLSPKMLEEFEKWGGKYASFVDN